MPEMDCTEAFKRLDDFLDRQLTSEEMEAVKLHLQKCQCCAEEFQFEESLIRSLRSKLAHIDLPCDLLQKMKNALDQL
ncbi:MAG: zf-HC2 domain-containing protein [Chthonomonadaceae bacterium]|nr:zf-HC2 domain-containing protein [Chthonomonadaceae bacterium]